MADNIRHFLLRFFIEYNQKEWYNNLLVCKSLKNGEKMKKTIIQKIFISDETNTKSNFLWNTIGTGMLAAATMLFTVIVAHLSGEKAGGQFSFALTIGQWIGTIAYFELRTFQVTDVARKYSYAEYFYAKIFCCMLAVFAGGIYVMFRGGTAEKALFIFLLCVYKILDGYSDLYEGELQRYGRIDIAGKLLFWRVSGGILILTVGILLTQNLAVAVVAMILYSSLLIFVINEKALRVFEKGKLIFRQKEVVTVLIECLPLFLSSFLNTYVYSASRMSVDKVLDSRYQLYYAAIFMPVMIINLFSTFVFKPLLSVMAEDYEQKRKRQFFLLIFKVCAIIAAVTAVCEAGAYLLGIPVLSILYGINLEAYKIDLLILLLAGGINALAFFMYYILTIMRKQKYALVGYGIEAVAAFLISDQLVRKYAIRGASLSYLTVVTVLLTTFVLFMIYNIWRGKKKNEE